MTDASVICETCPRLEAARKLLHQHTELHQSSGLREAAHLQRISDLEHEVSDLKAALSLQAQQIERMQQELQCFRPFRLNVQPTVVVPAMPAGFESRDAGSTLQDDVAPAVAV